MRIVSGIQPTGPLHLGHLLGALRDHVKEQDSNECFYLVADYHALIRGTISAAELQKNIFHVAAAYLACGLDPEKASLYRQSDLPEICELTWILTTVTSMGVLERAVAVKDARARSTTFDAGLVAYPVLMAADILLLGAEVVPVGRDQLQHVEICRDIARRFNHRYGEGTELLHPPASRLTSHPYVPGTDHEKMSKRYKNTIDIFTSEDAIRASVNAIRTDFAPAEAPKDPETSTVHYLYSLIASPSDAESLAERYRKGIKYSEAKQILADAIIEFTRDIRARYAELCNDRAYVLGALAKGAARTKPVAAARIEMIRNACGLRALEAGR